MLILQTLRAASHQEASLRAGRWRDLAVLGKDHRGLTLGIVGFGRIGGVRPRPSALERSCWRDDSR